MPKTGEKRFAVCRELGVSYSVRRYYVDRFLFKNVPLFSAQGKVLDLGGTKTLKRGRFDISGEPVSVCYINVSRTKCPDVQGIGEYLPFRDESFDYIICSEVLEHVPDPRVVLAQSRRVLRNNGYLLINVPFLYRIHGDPNDYGRYTDSYWHMTLGELNFEIISLERQGGYMSVLADWVSLLFMHSQPHFRRPFLKRLRKYILAPSLNLFCRLAVQVDGSLFVKSDPFLSSFTTGFGILAKKAAV